MKKYFFAISLVVVGLLVMGCQGPATPSIDEDVSPAIIFKAASTEHPSNPEVNWAYYNTTDKTWYIWDGSSWLVLAVKGDTGEKGDTGDSGADGVAGTNGADGSVVTIGNNGNWLIDGTDTGISALGVKGDSGNDGNVGAKGDKGEKGDPGTPGTVISIGGNGNWFIGDTDTGIPAKGQKGDKGEPGQDYTLNNKLLVRWEQMVDMAPYSTLSIDDWKNSQGSDASNNLAVSVFSSMGYNYSSRSAWTEELPQGIQNCIFDKLDDQPENWTYSFYIVIPELTYGLGSRSITQTEEYEVQGFYQGYHVEVWKVSDSSMATYGRNYSLSKK